MSEISGQIIHIGETQTFGNNGFRKREFVIKTEGEWPQEIQLELVQDKVGLLDNFRPGANVKASYNLRGRSWTNPQGEVKWFNTIQAWRLEGATGGQNQSAADAYLNKQKSGPENAGNEFLEGDFKSNNQEFRPGDFNGTDAEEDDLPFSREL